MIIKYKRLFPDAKAPRRASKGAVGYDVYAYHVQARDDKREHLQDLPVTIEPGKAVLIGIGIAMAVPFPSECEVRPRSGLANKFDIELSNSPGTIDPDFRGEAGILLRNRGENPFVVDKDMRIAQIIFNEIQVPVFKEVEDLPATSRAAGGFGSTGLRDIALGDDEYLQEQLRLDKYFLNIAHMGASQLSNCLRGVRRDGQGNYMKDAAGVYLGATRRFGCVIVKDGVIVAQGFNQRTSECSEECGCVRDREKIPSGTSLERGCKHAEVDAIQNHGRVGGAPLEGATVYVNAEPCHMCATLLSGCGIAAVVVPIGVYPTNGLKYLEECGVEIRRIPLDF